MQKDALAPALQNAQSLATTQAGATARRDLLRDETAYRVRGVHGMAALGHLVCPWTQAPQNGCPLAHWVTVCEKRTRFTRRRPARPSVRRGHGENQYSLCVHESNSRLHAEAHTRPRGCLKAHRALERVRCFGRRSLVPDNRHFCCLSRAHSRHASTGRARGRHLVCVHRLAEGEGLWEHGPRPLQSLRRGKNRQKERSQSDCQQESCQWSAHGLCCLPV
jgi:hypothetical protein